MSLSKRSTTITIIDEAMKVRLIDAMEELGNVAKACKALDLSYATVKRIIQNDAAFAEAMEEAREIFCASIEDEVIRRARDGYEEPVFYKGMEVGTVRKYSDRMLELAAKANMPEKYNERFKMDSKIVGGVMVVRATAESVEDWMKDTENEKIPSYDESFLSLPEASTKNETPDGDR